ncbi:MAG: hypothetical protein ACJ75B_03010 [Flavisolibacter sp.]
MKNQTIVLPKQLASEEKVQSAVKQIENWVEKNYPALSANQKSKLILECLIELATENKLIAA